MTTKRPPRPQKKPPYTQLEKKNRSLKAKVLTLLTLDRKVDELNNYHFEIKYRWAVIDRKNEGDRRGFG